MRTTADTGVGTDAQTAFPVIARLRFRLTALDRIRLPAYAGSTWRGLLGQGLRRAACVTRLPACAGCLLLRNCVFADLFEARTPPEKGTERFAATPRPYVLEPDPLAPRDIAPGDHLGFGLTLIGPVIEQIPSLIYALHQAGQLGVGRSGGRFEVDRLECRDTTGSGDWQTLYREESGTYSSPVLASGTPPPAPRSAQLVLYTPLRLKRHGHFVGARDFNAADFLLGLFARLRLLADHYGGDPHVFDWERFYQPAKEIKLENKQLRWHDWTRYSSRQDALMQLGGLLGEVTFLGETLPTLWPALWYGHWVHVGKGTTFGLGGYRLTGAGDPNTPQ